MALVKVQNQYILRLSKKRKFKTTLCTAGEKNVSSPQSQRLVASMTRASHPIGRMPAESSHPLVSEQPSAHLQLQVGPLRCDNLATQHCCRRPPLRCRIMRIISPPPPPKYLLLRVASSPVRSCVRRSSLAEVPEECHSPVMPPHLAFLKLSKQSHALRGVGEVGRPEIRAEVHQGTVVA